MPIRERKNLRDIYKGADEEALVILYKMLAFNPNTRITASEALEDKYFDDIRLPEQEELPSEPLVIDIEEDELRDFEDIKASLVELFSREDLPEI
jgi:serine/threonine protein kinase